MRMTTPKFEGGFATTTQAHIRTAAFRCQRPRLAHRWSCGGRWAVRGEEEDRL